MKKVIILSLIAFFTLSGMAFANDTNTYTIGGAGNIGEGNNALNQGQGQGQQLNIGDGAFSDNRTVYGSDIPQPKRYFAPAGEINYPGAPNYFGSAHPSYMDALKVKDMLEYNEDGLTTAMQKAILGEKSGGKRVLVRPFFGTVRKEDRIALDAPMPIVTTKQADMKSVGTITVVSDSTGAISPDVFAAVQVEAWELGGRKMHLKAEGFQREVHNEGKGIGFSWTGSTISDGQSSAMTGVLGFGATWGQAGYYDHPYIVIHVLIPKTKDVVDQ